MSEASGRVNTSDTLKYPLAYFLYSGYSETKYVELNQRVGEAEYTVMGQNQINHHPTRVIHVVSL